MVEENMSHYKPLIREIKYIIKNILLLPDETIRKHQIDHGNYVGIVAQKTQDKMTLIKA